jgi:hypothetical protein
MPPTSIPKEGSTVLVAGAQVVIERERFHDGYMLLAIP